MADYVSGSADAAGSRSDGGIALPVVVAESPDQVLAHVDPVNTLVTASARSLVSQSIRQAAIDLTRDLNLFDVTQALTSAGVRPPRVKPLPEGLTRLQKILYVVAEASASSSATSIASASFNAVDWSQPHQVLLALGAISELLWLYELRLEEDGDDFLGTWEKALRLRRHLEIGGFHVDDNTVIHPSSAVLESGSLAGLRDPGAIRAVLTRISKALPDDPALAIGSAKELIEATAKTILAARGLAVTARSDLPQLVYHAEMALAVHPSIVGAGADGAPELRQLLGRLTSLTNSAAELRNKLGTGHGVAALPEGLRPRHGRLAVAAASAWCFFMLDTLVDPDASWRDVKNELQPNA